MKILEINGDKKIIFKIKVKLRNIILLTVLTIVRCCYVYASENPLANYRYSVKNLLASYPDAVELNIIFQVFEDKSGFIWIATENGLIRYDGYRLKYFLPDPINKSSIAHYQIKCFAEDSSGNIWIGLYRKGVDCYNPKTGNFAHYPFDKKIKSELSVKNVYVDKENNVWIVTSDNRLAKLDKQKGNYEYFEIVTAGNSQHVKTFSPDRYNRGLAKMVDGDNNDLWITTAFGLYNFNKGTKKSTAYSNAGANPQNPVYLVNSLIRIDDILWMASWSGGLRSFNIKTKEWSVFPFRSKADLSYSENWLDIISLKNDDELWIATNNRGLGTFNINSKKFSYFSDDPENFPELNLSPCYYVFQDSKKNIWTWCDNKVLQVSASERSVFKLKIPALKKDKANSFYTTDVLEESTGRYLLIGTVFADGMYLMDRQTGLIETFGFPTSLEGEKSLKVLKFIEINNSCFWVVTRDRLMLFDLKIKKWLDVKQPPLFGRATSSNIYDDGTMDNDSNLWLTTLVPGTEGIIFYNTKSQTSKLIQPSDVHNAKYFNKIRTIICDKQNRLWFRNRSARMSGYYDIKTNTEILLDENGKQSQTGVGSISISEGKKGKILAATDEGLLVYDANGRTPVLKYKLKASNGLKSDMVEDQAEDSRGNIWYRCNNAIYRYDIHTGKNEIFKLIDVFSNDIGPVDCGSDSLVYIHARFGMNIINLNKIKSDSTFSNIKLTSFQIDGNEIFYEPQLELKKRITIPAGYSYLSFEFANLDMRNSENLFYSYKLEGIDDDWINSAQRRTASYTNLPSGNYKLFVRCALGNNDWCRPYLEIPIYVETIFYKTTWFRLSLLVLLASLMYAIYRYRTSQQRAIDELNNRAQLLEKEKSVVHYENLKQQLNPHFLFNSLTSLSSLITTEPKIARQFVDQMSKIYRYILKSNEHETVPLINEINFANTYVKLQQTRFRQGFEVNFNISEEYNDRKIVPVTIQNMIENAIKHNIIDEESPLAIDIYIEDEYLVVKNNLQKKSVVESSNKVGLEKMKTLYKYLIDKPIVIAETSKYFSIKIPLI